MPRKSILVRALGTGLGLASEAIHNSRSRSRSGTSPANGSNSQASSSQQQPADAPPEYYEVADEATANSLVRSGQAERVVDYEDEKKRGGLLSPEGKGQSKAAEAGYPEDDSDSELEEAGQDEAIWELDDMAERVAPPAYQETDPSISSAEDSEEVKVKKSEQMVRDIVALAGPPPQPAYSLPCPVIIPQKRPRNKSRGFVRAYAPVLAECGISQDVFLKFQDDWLKACKSDPWIEVVFVAAGVVGFIPEPTAQIVSTVVQVVAGTARELQSRHRRNNFLDMINQDLFMPRGLFAMVMAFKDQVPGQQSSGPLSRLTGMLGQSLVSSERLDINQTAAKYSNPDPELSKIKKGLQNIRLASGKTYGQLELPESAELVFPDLDRAVDKEMNAEGKGKGTAGSSNFKDKMKGAGEFVQDYLDRRAQAQYAAEHRGSALALPESSRTPFQSRFSDPNHPANSGSLIALLTGGAINPAARREAKRAARDERRAGRREYKDQRRIARGREPRGPRRSRSARGKREGTIKKLLQQDVLYLIIVNIPTEQEVQNSVARLESSIAAAQGR
ncbi:hypothetical protein GQ53DRAFT_708184 [Thozetella sp. PMI_491]|nr:hypothetical protein GQ53DRAFT_708184 [Thozetella sp. PMI_491]